MNGPVSAASGLRWCCAESHILEGQPIVDERALGGRLVGLRLAYFPVLVMNLEGGRALRHQVDEADLKLMISFIILVIDLLGHGA